MRFSRLVAVAGGIGPRGSVLEVRLSPVVRESRTGACKLCAGPTFDISLTFWILLLYIAIIVA